MTIDLSNGSTTSNASASTKLTGAGYCGGFIYGTNGDYENPCHFYKVDPANGFAETMGPESAASYSMLDAASAPALQVTFGDHEVTAFDRPVFIAQGQRLQPAGTSRRAPPLAGAWNTTACTTSPPSRW